MLLHDRLLRRNVHWVIGPVRRVKVSHLWRKHGLVEIVKSYNNVGVLLEELLGKGKMQARFG